MNDDGSALAGWPIGESEMAARIRAHDWTATPLGPIKDWPQTLKTLVDLMLASSSVMALVWGREAITLYNDAYARLIGPRHPRALGVSTYATFPEVRAAFEPHLAAVWRGETVQLENQLYPFIRTDKPEDAWFDITYTPVRDSHGQVIGSFSFMVETTGRVLAESARDAAHATMRDSEDRQAYLLRLSDALKTATDAVEVQMIAARLLGERLGAARAYYVEYESRSRVATVARDYVAGGAASLVGRYDYQSYRTVLERISNGRTWVVADVTAEDSLAQEEREMLAAQGVVAWVDVPLIKQGTLVAVLCVVQDAPRNWTTAEQALVEETAERTWAAVERARAELALHESERRYRGLIEASNEVLYRHNADWSEMRQLKGGDFLADTESPDPDWFNAYIHPEDQSQVLRHIRQAIETKGVFELEHRVIRNDGTLGWTLSRSIPVLADDGEIIEWFGAASDTSARRQAEEDLRASEEFKDRIIESTADCIKVLDLDGTLQWISHGGQVALEIDDFDTVRGTSWLDFWKGTTRERAAEAVRTAASGTTSRFSGVAPTFKGTSKWWESIITPMRGIDGRPERLLAISRDMSEQRRSIEALLASERRQRALIEGIPQLVWRAAAPGEWNWASPQWYAYTGLSREESMGWGWLDIVHPDDREAVVAAWKQAATSHELSIEFRICHSVEKHFRWFHTRAAPVYDAAGAVVEWLGTSTDVDDMRRLQDTQKVILAELQHRARNLLAVVRSIAGRTLGRGPAFDEFSGRLGALSRVQGFLARSDGFTVDLGEIVRAELDAHGIDGGLLRVRIDGPAIELPGEKSQPFALALHELATNAIKYGALSIPEGRLDVAWRIETDAAGGRALALDWRESGVGLEGMSTTGERLGYGRELIERALPYQLGAETRLNFTPEGVECSIRVPLAMLAGAKG